MGEWSCDELSLCCWDPEPATDLGVEMGAQGWSLNPGRYVGVAERAIDDFDFKERLESLEVRVTDVALDMGCGAGFIGCHMARLATKGQVTMVDASLVAVEEVRRRVEQSGLTNAQVLSSDGAQAVSSQRFDLVVTNPPFHIGGIQTTRIGERFIREAAQVLRPRGRFYLVANRFLKYEPTMRSVFKTVEEVGGDTRFKVLRGIELAAGGLTSGAEWEWRK